MAEGQTYRRPNAREVVGRTTVVKDKSPTTRVGGGWNQKWGIAITINNDDRQALIDYLADPTVDKARVWVFRNDRKTKENSPDFNIVIPFVSTGRGK